MTRAIDGPLLIELFDTIGEQRHRDGQHDAAVRSWDAAETVRLTSHWRETGWHQPGKRGSYFGEEGRGVRDMHMPSKLP